MALVDNNKFNIQQLLTTNRYVIPRYQRGYAWQKNEVEDFWNDLIILVETDEIDEHFLGLVVTHSDPKDKKTKYVIDGQQRLSTITILLDAIRKKLLDIFKESDLQDVLTIIQSISNIIGTISDESEKRDKPRMILGEKDKKFFRYYIQNTKKIEPIKSRLSKSERRIFEASQFFDSRINDKLEEFDDKNDALDYLATLVDKLLEDFSVMYIEADEENEAFIIFETLNARGKALDTSDLLKNHIFRVGNHKIQEIQEKWNEMLDNLDKTDATTFIRHFWNSRNKYVSTQVLYKMMKLQIVTPKNAMDFINALTSLSKLYGSLKSKVPYYENFNLNNRLENLSLLSFSSFYPVILAMETRKFEEKDINSIVKNIETLLVRNILISGQNPNTFEKLFAKIAYEITNEVLDNVDDIIVELKKEIIDDETFMDNFKEYSAKTENEKRYILRLINQYENDETKIIDNNNVIHIEHIMPQTIGEWKISKEDHETYKNRIGNLTLLGSEFNKKASNGVFEKKKEIYMKSKIKISNNLQYYEKWGIQEINSRQKELGKIALKVWKK